MKTETRFLKDLLAASQRLAAVDALTKALGPAYKAARIRSLASKAGWRATDASLSAQTRQQYLDLARKLDILVDGKTFRPATLPTKHRIWNPAPIGADRGD